MTIVGEITINKAKAMLCGLIGDYEKEISKAYEKANETLTVNLSIKFVPHRTDAIQVKTTINFPLDKIKAETVSLVDENQREIPFPNSKLKEINSS